MICTSCLHPNDPETKYCQGCGAPLGPTAALGAWEQTQAQGFAIRQATTNEHPRLILVLEVWLIFFPMWIVAALLLGLTVMNTNWEIGDKVTMVVLFGLMALSTALLYRSAANYCKRRSRPAEAVKS